MYKSKSKGVCIANDNTVTGCLNASLLYLALCNAGYLWYRLVMNSHLLAYLVFCGIISAEVRAGPGSATSSTSGDWVDLDPIATSVADAALTSKDDTAQDARIQALEVKLSEMEQQLAKLSASEVAMANFEGKVYDLCATLFDWDWQGEKSVSTPEFTIRYKHKLLDKIVCVTQGATELSNRFTKRCRSGARQAAICKANI